MAETRKAAEAALDAFIETHGVKYDKAAECLTKDRQALFAFCNFPAEHWKHLRTTNPIESTFATSPASPVRSRGASRKRPPEAIGGRNRGLTHDVAHSRAVSIVHGDLMRSAFATAPGCKPHTC
jgi:hypothetical protein